MLDLSSKVLAAARPTAVDALTEYTPPTVTATGPPGTAAERRIAEIAKVAVPAALIGTVAWRALHPAAGVALGGGYLGLHYATNEFFRRAVDGPVRTDRSTAR